MLDMLCPGEAGELESTEADSTLSIRPGRTAIRAATAARSIAG
jgi:hypothetical protein